MFVENCSYLFQQQQCCGQVIKIVIILLMDFVQRRENDPQYLKTVIAQREIVIEQREHQKSKLQKQVTQLTSKIEQLTGQLQNQKTSSSKQIQNLSLALREMEHQNDQLRDDKTELQFQMNVMKIKNQEQGKENTKEIYRLKNQFESQKDMLNQKISKLEKNLTALNHHYRIDESINDDKHKIIQDANRNLRGFANQKQQRMIIIQNQQLTNQIEFQSRQITSLLQKNQKLQEEIKALKMDVQLHKNIENDLVKRSSLSQNLIKQLNNRIRELEAKLDDKEGSQVSIRDSTISERRSSYTQQQSRGSESSQINNNRKEREAEEIIAKLKFQNANLKNVNHFLQTSQKNYNKKYENLGQIMAQYLQILLLENKNKPKQQPDTLTIDINSLKTKDIKEWKPEQTEVVLQLLITQIKPYISKSSLCNFPEAKNIKVSFVEEQAKDPISLPKIVEEYEKNQTNNLVKKQGRFKDIPVDISTKILRSNLREWGTKVNYGNNLPRTRRQPSKSIIVEVNKQKQLI